MKTIFKSLCKAALTILKPVLTKVFLNNPERLTRYQEQAQDVNLSGMVTEFNLWHRLIFVPFFRRVQVVSTDIDKVKSLQGPVVFVMKNKGQLEYRYFNHLFLKEGIPLVGSSNSCFTLLWLPFAKIWAYLMVRLQCFYGFCDDKIKADYDVDQLSSGQKLWLNLSISRDYLFGLIRTSPLMALKPLVDVQSEQPESIHVVTLQFLYDKHPDKASKSYFDLLFGEKSQPGAIRKFLLFVMNYFRKPQIKFGEPLALKPFLEQGQEQVVEGGAQRLLSEIEKNLKIEKIRITGPELQSRDALVQEILASEETQKQISALVDSKKKSKDVVQKSFNRYLYEMAADVSYSLLHFVHISLGYLWNHIFDGIVIKHDQLNKIREMAGNKPLVMLPMHRSHIDYLLISDIFYERNITFPHVCAGINLNFWPIGTILRRSGAFFIRRSFRNEDPIYKEAVYAYLKTLVNHGYCIEFFIEGTRSRTGKMLKPRTGILSMLMRAYFEKACEDILFVPISINYDHIVEHKSYQKEKEGSDKVTENARQLMKVRKIIKKKFGKVYIEFGDPVSLKDYCTQKGVAEEASQDMRDNVGQFATELSERINQVAVVTPMAIVSLAVLSLKKQRFTFEDILTRVAVAKDYLDRMGVVYSDMIHYSDRYAYSEAVSKLCDRHILKEVREGSEPFYVFEDKNRSTLDYYKNNIIHFFLNLTCVLKAMTRFEDTRDISIEKLIKEFEMIQKLFAHDFVFSHQITAKSTITHVLEYAHERGWMNFDADRGSVALTLNSKTFEEFDMCQSLLDDCLESHLIVLRYLKQKKVAKQEVRSFIRELLSKNKQLYLQQDLSHPEVLSRFHLENSVYACIDLGLFTKELSPKSHDVISSSGDDDGVEQWKTRIQDLLKGFVHVSKDTSHSSAKDQDQSLPRDSSLH